MYSIVVQYEDPFTGEQKSDKLYFNITKTEAMKYALENQSLERDIQDMIDSNDSIGMLKAFESIVLKAYGEKSEDGKRFIKSPEVAKAFTQTAAYDELFWNLVTKESAMAEFVNGIIPDIPEINETNRNQLTPDQQKQYDQLEAAKKTLSELAEGNE